MKKKLLKSMRVLLVAAGLCVGANDAWATVTQVWSADFSSAPSGMSYSVNRGEIGIDNGFLLYHCSTKNGITTTASFTDSKFQVSSAWKMEFDWEAESGNTEGSSATFVTNKGNAFTISWTSYAGTATITDANSTSLTTTLPIVKYANSSTTISTLPTKITVVGDPNHGVYLTVTNGGTTYVDNVLVTSTFGYPSAFNGSLGRYYSKMALDNIIFSTMDAPAFTLSATTATPTVGGNETVGVTGITGSISVISSNTDIATATYSDGTITINGVADGVANITVTGTNDGLTTSQIIEATVGSVATTDITVNYLCGGSAIADPTTIEGVTIGSSLTVSDITYSETIAGSGCRYVNPSFSVDFPYTVEEDGVINISYTQQNAVSSLNVYANVNSTNYLIKTYELDSKYVGDVVTITYPEYYLLDGTLYSTPANTHSQNSYYKWDYTLEGNSVEIPYGTTAATNVVYYVEAENITGATANSSSNANIRCSEAAGAYFGSETNIVTLPAGSYTIYTQVWGNAGTTFTFKTGEETIHEHTTTGALNPNNSSFTLIESKTITVSASGSSGKVLDLVYIVQTGVSGTIPSSGYGSLASAYGLDFSNATGLTAAYVVTNITNSAVTLTSVDELPGNSGVILKGTASATYSIPVKADAAYDGTNKLYAAVTAYDCAANEVYILQGGLFHLVTAASTVPAGKAYLKATDVPAKARSLGFLFGDDEATSINSVSRDLKNGEFYNLQGQRVDTPKKGVYIVNGTKVIIK